jgi:ribosomal protein L11 methyltransferase
LQKHYYELIIKPDTYYELFLDLITDLTNEAIEELDGQIICRSESSLKDIMDGVELFRKELSNAFQTEILCLLLYEQKDNENWINMYKDSIKPVETGQFYIHPSWEEPKNNKVNIIIDPALAFGSGHHETTSSCLDLISQYGSNGQTLLDVGCGSGILGIAASKLDMVVDICDTDIVSIDNATENFHLNNVKANKSWVGSAIQANDKYNLVVANIVADVLIMISSDLKKLLKENSILILSGILSKYQDKVISKFKEYEILQTINKGDWVTITLKKVNN